MTSTQDQNHFNGYLAGYQDGLRDAASGKVCQMQEDFLSLPVRSMNLSTRAFNCLSRNGCSSIGDVAKLSDYAILTMRNLGPKTAAEVANWLNAHGICSTAWHRYL